MSTVKTSPPRPVWRRVLLASLRVVGALVVVALAALILGAFIPALPGIGVVGSVASGFSTWIGIALLVALIATVLLARRRRTAARVLVAGIAALALVGSVTITTQLVATGRANGVTISPFATMPASRAPDEVATYGEYEGEDLDVAIWRSDTATANAPIAFITHGGGWVEGTPTDDWGGMIPKLTADGWLVVSAAYTLATPDLHTAGLAESQVACAMAWTSQNADTYGGDAATFVSLGDSAGGNLAINTSYRANAGDLSCDQVGPMPEVSATATLFPAVDPYSFYTDTVTGGTQPGQSFLDRYIGGSPEEYPEEYDAVDSFTHISQDAPPTLILQGANDHLVQAHGARAFTSAAQGTGIDTTLVVVPHGEHVFQFAPLGAELYTGITLKWLHANV